MRPLKVPEKEGDVHFFCEAIAKTVLCKASTLHYFIRGMYMSQASKKLSWGSDVAVASIADPDFRSQAWRRARGRFPAQPLKRRSYSLKICDV